LDKTHINSSDNYSVIIDTQVSERELKAREQVILTYSLKYPQFSSEYYANFIAKLNLYYSTKTELFQRFDIKRLYQLAYEDYEASLKNGYPFHPYEVYSDFTVTYNKDCIISMYFDTYEYTGGAHGMTVREADTWNLSTNTKVELSDLFVYPSNYEEYVTNNILQQIDKNIKQGNNFYFDDYKQTVVEKFNKRDFYLTEDGIVIFYQLYDIAPYSSGIMTFLIPYKEGEVVLPTC
jgi:hypothetical protein